MSSKESRKLSLALTIIISIIILSGCIPQSECKTIDKIDAEIVVKESEMSVIGLNADTDDLNFGIVSPTASARKSVNVDYSLDTNVKVTMEGELAEWAVITPGEFYLSQDETKKVHFDIKVPSNAGGGNYTGKAVFCFK